MRRSSPLPLFLPALLKRRPTFAPPDEAADTPVPPPACDAWYCVNTSRSWEDISSGAIMSAAVGACAVILFSLLRNRVRVYRTRLLLREVSFKPPDVPGKGKGLSFLWNWAVHVICVSERTLYDTAGLDALYYDRSNRLCLLVCFVVAALNLGVVMPVNFSIGSVWNSAEVAEFGGMSPMDRLSMTNIPAASPLLWVHTLVVILTVVFVCGVLWVHFVNFRADRQAFLGHLVDPELRASTSRSSSLRADAKDLEGDSLGDDDDDDARFARTMSGSSRPTTPTLAARSVESLLHRQLSVHIGERETALSANTSNVSLDVSQVHSPVSVFHRQHVSVTGLSNATGSTLAVKAQQYAVLVTNVDPTSSSIRNPEGLLPANRAAELEVSRAFAALFPDFVAAVPAQWHETVDHLLCELDTKQVLLMRVVERIETLGATDASALSGCAAKLWKRRETLEHDIKQLAGDITVAQQEAVANPRSAFSFFVLFKSQSSAAIAAQTLIQDSGGELAWTVREAPAPDDVAYSGLWKTPREKWARSLLARLAVAGIVIFPIGVFTSSMLSLSAALCTRNSEYYWRWYCENQSNDGPTFFFRLLTAWVPSLLLAAWNSIVVPYGFAFLALFEGTEPTLSGIDIKIFRWFYLYACLNVLLGGMLAGTLFSQLENIIRSPSSVFLLLGHAVPQSSGFFLAYVSTQALMLEPVRLLIPHTGVLLYFFRGCGERTKCCGRTERDRKASWAPMSLRLGAHYGSQQLILLVCLVFSTASPLITAVSLVFFAFSFLVWRHHVLFVFVRSYESGASMFPHLFSRIINSLFMYQAFMSAYLLIKQAYTQAFVLWILGKSFPITTHRLPDCPYKTDTFFFISLVPPLLFQFRSHCLGRFVTKSAYLPLAVAAEMPTASVPGETFVAPQMRDGFKGWGAQIGKVWQGYGPYVAKYA